jgi:hypothetical protein
MSNKNHKESHYDLTDIDPEGELSKEQKEYLEEWTEYVSSFNDETLPHNPHVGQLVITTHGHMYEFTDEGNWVEV